jgi:hypothetical protein
MVVKISKFYFVKGFLGQTFLRCTFSKIFLQFCNQHEILFLTPKFSLKDTKICS